MDILDIDEALKDDSYIFQADKTHDDVSNILQQWKTNNQPQLQMQMHLQCNNEAYKHNTKTFTRPKRRNLDFQTHNGAGNDSGVGTPAMLQLEIGGLVTTNMHKSFLQDTSPPSSICSSMNTERMNNSLITSADFTNLNFLQSTISLEQEPSLTTTLTNQTTDNMVAGMGVGGGLAGYTLSDMIRDRKALESLTLCEEDGTLTKDSHIGQIDEISLTLSKTASGCSTMDNSTDSMSNPLAPERPMPAAFPILQRTMILGEELIGDTTFNLVDSLTTSVLHSDAESIPMDGNATFKRPSASSAAPPAADETLLLAGRQMNTTYTEGCNTPEARCETPENIDRKLALLTMESTPLTTNIRPHYYHNNNNKQGYTPTLKGRGDMNLSPIVSVTPQKPAGAPGRLNNTFEPATKAAPFDGEKFVLDTMELLEQIEQPLDGTYSLQMSEQHKQMQCVMDLAEAEVELLAQQGDEEQFEHMLAELGKVNTLNEDQLKMQKSLDTIKRRFHRDEPEAEPEREEEEQQLPTPVDKVETPTLNQSHSSSNNSSSGTGERLLSRRSRLYDDVNLSVMHGSNGSSASCNSASFIVQRRDVPQEEQPAPEPEPEPAEDQRRSQVAAAETDPSSYKLAERRERDRERFKTIKISRDMRLQQEIIVPCIDDEPQQLEEPPQQAVEDEEQFQDAEQQSQRQASPPSRLSRRDQNFASNNNNYKAEGSASNYLTYKKPKEKSLLQRQMNAHPSAESTLPQPRSLSRPRYISGLQKFTTVSKATSAGAGLNSTTAAVPVAVPVPSSTELKSPMGIKSKSFHNLSSTMSGIAGAGALPRPSLGGGLRRPGGQPSKLTSGLRVASQSQEDDSAVFKVPKLVSGLRGPGLAGAKRAGGNGLARPSSGYYSLSTKTAAEADTPESLSSASSRGSLYGHKDSGRTANGGNVPQQHPSQPFDTQALTSKLTQVTTGATGIPKPSGLRPPSQMKRSGLPRPSSIVRR